MTGPPFPEGHLDEMTEQELRIAMTYLYGSVAAGLREGLDEEVVEILISWYDESFLALAGASDDFVRSIGSARFVPPSGLGDRAKYLVLAGLASEN